jgi:hypothetical protein
LGYRRRRRKRIYNLTASLHKRGTTGIALALKEVVLLILIGEVVVLLPRKRRGERNIHFNINTASVARITIRLSRRKRHSLRRQRTNGTSTRNLSSVDTGG